jgi:peptidylprolyl isomerase
MRDRLFSRCLLCALGLLAAVALAACGSGGSSDETTQPRRQMSTAEIAALPKFKISPAHGPAPGELVVHDLRKGTGAVMRTGDSMTVAWAFAPYGRGLVADPNRYGQPQKLPFDGVLAGWEQGLPGMKVGGRRELIMPQRLGDTPTATVYQIDLIAIEPPR